MWILSRKPQKILHRPASWNIRKKLVIKFARNIISPLVTETLSLTVVCCFNSKLDLKCAFASNEFASDMFSKLWPPTSTKFEIQFRKLPAQSCPQKLKRSPLGKTLSALHFRRELTIHQRWMQHQLKCSPLRCYAERKIETKHSVTMRFMTSIGKPLSMFFYLLKRHRRRGPFNNFS